MKILYIIVQARTHRHNIGGVFEHIEDARKTATDNVLAEVDHYHEWEILKFELGKAVEDGLLIERITWNDELKILQLKNLISDEITNLLL